MTVAGGEGSGNAANAAGEELVSLAGAGAIVSVEIPHMNAVIDTASQGEKLTVTVKVSRLDAALARDFKAGVEAGWVDGLKVVEIDLGAVDFVDSSGVGALLSVYRRLPNGSGVTRLRQVKPPVMAVLELLRLHRVFEIAA